MKPEQDILFPPFRLDIAHGQLWRGSQAIPLRPKTFAVLHYLLEHPGQLVSREELLKAVWAPTYVSEAMPRLCIREIRGALGDNPYRPQFIETISRQGWRFIGTMSHQLSVVSSQQAEMRTRQLATQLVGREAELQRLQRCLKKALTGERQVVFVTGEPGIGKTTLVDVFLERIITTEEVWVAKGQCIEQYGAGEAYMPVLEALERLCHTVESKRLIELLRQHALTWLVQMPSLIDPIEREDLQRRLTGTTQERMLREMAQAVEVLTTEKPLVLVLEDLPWSDYSTLGLLAFLARRREWARLLVIGTYRPVEVLSREHPLRRVKEELHVHGLCEELSLGLLDSNAVEEYVAARFAGSALPLEIGRLVYQRTEGNPLFMANVVDYVVEQGLIVQSNGRWELKNKEIVVGVPTSIRQFIAQQIDRLSPEDQRTLEAASVTGMDFSTAAVAAGLEEEVEEVEKRCERLARQEQFLRPSAVAEWPDGTVSSRYGFVHALYQEVLYKRVTTRWQIRLHQKIGEREEQGYGERAGEIAAELAMHFEEGRDYQRAIQYLRQAGENAIHRCADEEAITHLTKGLGLLKTQPDTPERTQQELALQTTLAPVLMATKGFGAPEVENTYNRARQLCQQTGETSQLFSVLLGLRLLYLVRGEARAAYKVGEQLLTLAQRVQDPTLLLQAHHALGDTVYFLGELVRARKYQEQAIALYNPQRHSSLVFGQGYDLGMDALAHAAWVLWYLGYPDQALKRSHEALTLARELAHPFSFVHALNCTAFLRQLRREGQAAQEQVEVSMGLATDQGFAEESAWGTILRGWALTEEGQGEEGIAQIRQGLAAYRVTGAQRPHLLFLLAEAYGKVGQTEEGLAVVAELLATVHKTGERLYEAELYRLKGELSLQSRQVQAGQDKSGVKANPQKEAEACFHKAISIARQQSAKSLELRAIMSLCRLWQQQGKQKAARQMLAEIYGWFTEGFDTRDLQEARALLEQLS